MGTRIDPAVVDRDAVGPLERLLRLGLVVYLAPVLLAVFAIGLVGMVASRFGKPAARVAADDARTAHKVAQPLGLARKPSRARERV